MMIMNDYKPCVICGRLGIEKRSEVLPDKGTLIKVFHNDATECAFEEYPSISTFLIREKRNRDPKIMICPICKQNGRISWYRPNKDKKIHNWKYLVVHESLKGYWGRSQKIKRYRRCYLKTGDQRREALRELGRLNIEKS